MCLEYMSNQNPEFYASGIQTIVQQPPVLDSQQPYPIIQIGAVEAFCAVATFVFASGIAWGTLRSDLKHVEKTLDSIEPKLSGLVEKFSVVEDRTDNMWKDKFAPSNSPRQLNERGKNVLENSGIKKVIDKNRDRLLKLVKKRKSTNAYDAEKAVYFVMIDMQKEFPEVMDGLKNDAFRLGVDIDVVLFVGSIYLRNLIFKDLGFSVDDLDVPKKD